jgi:multisubunit Na+/H+ antiporter MnhF subunit
MMETDLYRIFIQLSFGALLLAMLLALVRLIKGPETSDRIVALDLIASIVMGFILAYSIVLKREIYIDIAIIISLISFIGTVATSIYLRQKR